jgi:RNA polymerase sigma-70 factor (ECF subfamily)
VSAPTDEQLLADYLAGQADGFASLVGRYSPELFQFVMRFTGNAAAAEDIVQEAFLQVHLAARNFDPERRFKPWLFTIAANKARDHLRSRSRRPEAPLDAFVEGGDDEGRRFMDLLADAPVSPTAGLEQEELRKAVERIVGQMPEMLREVLLLGYYHRMPYKDMAEVLGIPLGTVKSRLHAAVGWFAKQYRAVVEEEV